MAKPTQKTFVTGDQNDGPVECLGMTFPNDQARREYFLDKLKEKLKTRSSARSRGFRSERTRTFWRCPTRLTTRPARTRFSSRDSVLTPLQQAPERPSLGTPFPSDVTEGKTDQLYNAHSYHTKVPPRAVARYILWYTQPGDVVLDAYCGSGMSGVASHLCAEPDPEFRHSIEAEWGSLGKDTVPWGERLCILNDLSPAATFIASNYVHNRSAETVIEEIQKTLASAAKKFSWMYQTSHRGWPTGERDQSNWKNREPSDKKGRIVMAIWSEVLTCPNCGSEINLWCHGLDPKRATVKERIICPHCSSASKKLELNRREEIYWDDMLGKTNARNKFVPAFIIYDFNGKRYEKLADEEDLRLLSTIEARADKSPMSPLRMMNTDGPWGNMYRAGYHRGISHVHHFFTKRNWLVLSDLWVSENSPGSQFALTSLMNRLSKMSSLHMKYFFNGGGGIAAGNTKGNLYFPSLFIEQSPFRVSS